jgi:hypothetical protein
MTEFTINIGAKNRVGAICGLDEQKRAPKRPFFLPG